MSAGYSGTPLPRKLGIAPGKRVAFVSAPDGFRETLGELPEGATVRSRPRGPLDVIVFFTTSRAGLERRIGALQRALDPAGGLWVAWPKRASKVQTDMTEDVVREVALPRGLVDNKVAAIDDTWSGLRLVIREANRPGARGVASSLVHITTVIAHCGCDPDRRPARYEQSYADHSSHIGADRASRQGAIPMHIPMHKRTRTLAVCFAAALALGVTACGSEDEGSAGGTATQPATPQPVANVTALTGQQTEVAFDAGFVEALTMLKVTPGATGGGELTEAGVISFPITGGNVKYFTPGSVDPYVQGLINHEGSGLSLTAGGKRVALENFDVNPGTSMLAGDVSVDGTEAAADAPLFELDGSTLKPLRTQGNTAILQGTTVKLLPSSAALLNKTFGIDDLKGGMVVGVATITINTQ